MSNSRQIAAADVLTGSGALFQNLKNAGYSLIATNPFIYSYSGTAVTSADNGTNKVMHVAAAEANEIALVYGNFTALQPGQSFQGNYNPIQVGGALQLKGPGGYTDDTGEIVVSSFKNGKRKCHIDSGGIVITEPAFFPVAVGQVFYTRNYIGYNLPPAPTSVPVMTAQSTGGALAANTSYWVCYVFVYPDGVESATSVAAQVTVGSGSTNSVLVQSPFTIYNATATSGGTNTITNSGATWTTNQYAYKSVTIMSGTGVGQTRQIASNTSTAITTTTNWTTPPDSTSVFNITDPSIAGGAVGYKVIMGYSGGTQGALMNAATINYRVGAAPCDALDFNVNATINSYPSQYQNGYYYRQGGNRQFIGGGGGNGGTLYYGLNSGEGYTYGDSLDVNKGALTQTVQTNLYAPLAIIGRTLTPQKTIALIGDSIMASTGDIGYTYSQGGHGARACCNQFSNIFQMGVAPAYAHVRVPLGGETFLQFANALTTNQFNRNRILPTLLATNVLSNYGTNDLGGTLAALKASCLTAANWYQNHGIKFIQMTLLPRTSSTDHYQTLANQTINGSEAVRTGFNDWLLDTSASGFAQQTSKPSLAAPLDVCAGFEVNSSGVPTHNGGYWPIPTTPGGAITSVFTSGNNNQAFNDTVQALTQNDHKGWDLIVTSGAAVNLGQGIFYNGATQFNFTSTFATVPATGDSYKVTYISTHDGTHPSTWASIQTAQIIAAALPALVI